MHRAQYRNRWREESQSGSFALGGCRFPQAGREACGRGELADAHCLLAQARLDGEVRLRRRLQDRSGGKGILHELDGTKVDDTVRIALDRAEEDTRVLVFVRQGVEGVNGGLPGGSAARGEDELNREGPARERDRS